MSKLETCFPIVPKEKIEKASEKITYLARQLSNMPICESVAIGLGSSTKTVAKEIANENGLETGKVYDIIMSIVESMKSHLD